MNLQEKQQKASELKNQIREKQAQIEDLIKIEESKFSKVESGMQSLKTELSTQLLKSIKNRILSNYQFFYPYFKSILFKIEVLVN